MVRNYLLNVTEEMRIYEKKLLILFGIIRISFMRRGAI